MKKNLAILTAAGLSFSFLTPLVSYADSQTNKDLPKKYNVEAEKAPEKDLKEVLKNISGEHNVKNNSDQYEVVKKEKDDLGFTHYTLKPKVGEYFAENAEVKIHTDKSGEVVYINGDLDQGKLEIKNEVKIDKDKAIDLAYKSIGKSPSEVRNLSGADVLGEVKVVVNESINRAVYSIEMRYSVPEAAHWIIKVDAENGEIVAKQNVMENATQATGTGKGCDGKEKSPLNMLKDVDGDGKDLFYLSNKTHTGAIETSDFRSYQDPNDDSNYKVYGGVVCNNTNAFNDEKFSAAVDAHYFANEVYNYYKNVHGRDSYDGKGAPINSYVNVSEKDGQPMANAFWNGTEMAYGSGEPETFKPFSSAKDVVAHELTHAVTEKTANLIYYGQSGALNESFSDVFGYFVDNDDWTMGEDLYKKPNEALRDLQNPKKYYQPDNMRDYKYTKEDNAGVHTNSGIPNKAAYNTITKLGQEKSEKIYYRALTQYLYKNSNFKDARSCLVQSAKDLYGDEAASAVRQAWNSVGVYY